VILRVIVSVDHLNLLMPSYKQNFLVEVDQ
jgi:hypothetical protein